MNFHVMTLFPEMVMNGLNTSILGRAAASGLLSFEAINIRDYTLSAMERWTTTPTAGEPEWSCRRSPFTVPIRLSVTVLAISPGWSI